MENIDQKERDSRMWAMFAHLSALAGYIIPFGSIIGPLIIWSIKKDEFPFLPADLPAVPDPESRIRPHRTAVLWSGGLPQDLDNLYDPFLSNIGPGTRSGSEFKT